MLHLFKSVFGASSEKPARHDGEIIDWATEKLVDGTDTRLRLVGGYKRKLRDSVERSVTFVDEIVDSLPSPLVVDPREFTTNHEIRTWFGSIQTLREAFSLSLPVREFAAQTENASLTHLFAGMRASIDEKTVFVSEQRGDTIQRDVSRTAFSFTGHSIVAPTATEEALRLSVKERAYMNLVERSLAHLVSIKHRKSDLEKQRTLLRSKLRTLESRQLGMQPFADATSKEPADAAALETRLDEIEAQLGQTSASIATLDQHLARVIEVMSAPESQIRVTPASIRVTQMGIVATDDSTETPDEVEYTRVESPGLREFAVRLVTFPVNALSSLERFRPKI